MYKFNIDILNENGDELVSKQIKLPNLDDVLNIDLALLYAEAQQNELFDIGINDYDDSETYRETLE